MPPSQKGARPLIIAIDGPAGVGKSTVAKQVARALGVPYLDTGAMYRAVALAATTRRVSLTDRKALGRLAQSLRFALRRHEGRWELALNGRSLPPAIRSLELSQQASEIAQLKPVRDAMVHAQRELGRRYGAVAEGRDIGTVVFPRTPFKFYMTASIDERARRRLGDLRRAGLRATREAVTRALCLRDRRDQHRRYGPLRVAPGAQVIDSTRLQAKDVVRQILHAITRLLSR